MTRKSTTHWRDGTPKSQGNAFSLWRERQAMGVDSFIAEDYKFCTAAYNAWRSGTQAVPWPEFRDGAAKKIKRANYCEALARQGMAQVAGFHANRGTISGLSNKADAQIAAGRSRYASVQAASVRATQPGALLPLANGLHAGAFSKAKPATHGMPAHLARPAKPSKKASKT